MGEPSNQLSLSVNDLSQLPSIEISSEHLNNSRHIWIQLPESDLAVPRRLLILLDAEYYLERVEAVPIIAHWQQQLGDRAPLVAYVSHIDAETRFVECPCHRPFIQFITDELIPELQSEYTLTPAPHSHMIGGLSYTGLLAAYVALEAGDLFGSVLCQSASFWWNDGWLTQQVQTQSSLPRHFYISCGKQETDTNVLHREDLLQVTSQLASNRAMRDALQQAGYDVTYREFEGGHDIASWRSDLPLALDALLPPLELLLASALLGRLLPSRFFLRRGGQALGNDVGRFGGGHLGHFGECHSQHTFGFRDVDLRAGGVCQTGNLIVELIQIHGEIPLGALGESDVRQVSRVWRNRLQKSISIRGRLFSPLLILLCVRLSAANPVRQITVLISCPRRYWLHALKSARVM